MTHGYRARSYIVIIMDTVGYKDQVQNIKKYGMDNNLSKEKLNAIFGECFVPLETTNSPATFKFFRLYSLVFAISLLTLILYNHPWTNHVILRNVQDFIHPGLRILRKIAVPVITFYPRLTDWYNEWCLVQNPYFQVNEIDCWPCTTVTSVPNLTKLTIPFDTSAPFVYGEIVERVSATEIIELYKSHFSDLFDNTLNSNNGHVRWRINNMETNRKLRKLLPKLKNLPYWWLSPSMEKFIFLDGIETSDYKMPHTECANALLQCIEGSKLIELNPSPECTHKCKKLTVLLKAQQTLWYNWWYWRPTSFPADNSTKITITYLTSYC